MNNIKKWESIEWKENFKTRKKKKEILKKKKKKIFRFLKNNFQRAKIKFIWKNKYSHFLFFDYDFSKNVLSFLPNSHRFALFKK